MQAINRPFKAIINGTSQFVVPVFQRDYSWTEMHCEQLWQDILRIADVPSERGHFLGSLVYVSTGDSAASFTRWLLIDGQQRLTTLTLLLIALRDHIVATDWTGSEDGPTAKRIEAYFLKNVQEEGTREHKLVLRRHDHVSLSALLDGHELPDQISDRIRENYELFRERLEDVDPEMVYRGISRLIVVDVTLERGTDDPQLIFESLNSTGLDLSQSDLIRNFILMSLPESEQTRLYSSYWSRIETLFRDSEKTFDAFIRDFLALRTKASKQERSDQIYSAFRQQFAGIGSDPEQLEALLGNLERFARYHAAFSVGTEEPRDLAEPLVRLRGLVDVPAILIMRLFDCYERLQTLSGPDFVEAITLLESYVLRRAVCGLQTRGYWLEFARLAYRISDKKPLESLKVGLARLPENYAFPDNSAFREALEKGDIYHKRVCFHLLDRLENHDTMELTDTSTYSIEHVLPQNEKLRMEWREMLGEQWQEIQREWVNRLGNLTLTGYNSTYSDRPFEEKKSIKGGFADSSVRLNKLVREKEKWTAQEIRERGETLALLALEVWPNLRVDQSLIEAAKYAELRDQAERRDVMKVPMSAVARELFEVLRARILASDPEVVEMAERRSVSYHGPTFFLEVLPRKNKIVLLLALEFNEIKDSTGLAQDSGQWKFIVNAAYEAGVYVEVSEETDIDKAMPIIQKAHELART